MGFVECDFYTFIRSNQELLWKMQLKALCQESNLQPSAIPVQRSNQLSCTEASCRARNPSKLQALFVNLP